jgi:L-threonylcarbamoyladenylate synthase
VGIESTIVDLSRGAPVVLRPGAVTERDLRRVLGDTGDRPAKGAAPRAPGLVKRHYAPRTPAELVDTAALPTRHAELTQAGQRIGLLVLGTAPPADGIALPPDPAAYSRGLYAALRELDRRGYARLLIETPPRHEAWQGVRDRLNRAVA